MTLAQGSQTRASDARRLLDGLTAAQRRAVTVEAAPLCILAGAGAGKTRVLSRRIAYRSLTGSAAARHTLALTFTRKAAGELGRRLERLGLGDRVAAGTFHGVASAQLRRWWADRGQRPLALLERKTRLLVPLVEGRSSLHRSPVGELATLIEWAKARLIPPGEFEAAVAAEAWRLTGVEPAEVAMLYQRYEHEKQRRGLLDFDDLLAHCADAIDRDPAFASAQRWQWRHFLVDEFQDVNRLQLRLLTAWMGPTTDLCVVGDPNQAIYAWNGADPSILGRFAQRWPGATILHLEDNHRCTPQIVRAASAVLGEDGGTPRSLRPDGPAPAVRSYPSETAEARGVATGLRSARASGLAWSQMAVLVRTNAQSVPLQEACRRAGVPARTLGMSSLLEHPAGRRAIDEIRRQGDRPWPMVMSHLASLATQAATTGPSETGGAAEDDHGWVLSALSDLCRQYDRIDDLGGVRGFLEWLPTATGPDREGVHTDSVTLCSFHRAKGLEWPAVWVCGMEQGLVPIGQATAPEAIEEERRLLYVAVTRAERVLHCSWARQRTFGANAVARQPSPWLPLLAAAEGLAEQGPPSPAIDAWRTRLREQRERLMSEEGRRGRRPATGRSGERWPTADPAIVDALRAWRSDAARASGVPAHVVLHDVTLQALAGLRPGTTEALLEVPGLGPLKAGRYGEKLLALVAPPAASA